MGEAVESMDPESQSRGGLSMFPSRQDMPDRPTFQTPCNPDGDVAPRSVGARRSARRGAALPAHGRRLLLPLGADGALGADAPADAGAHVVPRRHVRAPVAGGGRSGRTVARTLGL